MKELLKYINVYWDFEDFIFTEGAGTHLSFSINDDKYIM